MLIERAMISDFLKESGVDAAFIEKDEKLPIHLWLYRI